MRLIDADKIHKAFKELAEDSFTKEDISCFLYAESMVDTIPTEKAIPIAWLQKGMVELLYDGEKVTDKDRFILNKLIARWEKENGTD